LRQFQDWREEFSGYFSCRQLEQRFQQSRQQRLLLVVSREQWFQRLEPQLELQQCRLELEQQQ